MADSQSPDLNPIEKFIVKLERSNSSERLQKRFEDFFQ